MVTLDYASQVEWTFLEAREWTRTTTSGMIPHHFAANLLYASSALCKQGIPRKYTGDLTIYQAYVPAGLSGGGVYANLPAKAVNPSAPAGAEGNLQASQNMY